MEIVWTVLLVMGISALATLFLLWVIKITD
jgi:hypothetical protein